MKPIWFGEIYRLLRWRYFSALTPVTFIQSPSCLILGSHLGVCRLSPRRASSVVSRLYLPVRAEWRSPIWLAPSTRRSASTATARCACEPRWSPPGVTCRGQTATAARADRTCRDGTAEPTGQRSRQGRGADRTAGPTSQRSRPSDS